MSWNLLYPFLAQFARQLIQVKTSRKKYSTLQKYLYLFLIQLVVIDVTKKKKKKKSVKLNG